MWNALLEFSNADFEFKTGIPLHGIEACDKVWYTCCALHNFPLEENQLSERCDVNKYTQLDEYHNDAGIF